MEFIKKFDNYSYEKIKRLPIESTINISTVLGHPVFISFVLFVLGVSLVKNGYETTGWSVLIQIPLLISISLIKIAVRRIRPKKHFQAQVLIDTYSFPSGHAYASMVLCGTLFYILSQFGYSVWAVAVTCLMFFVAIIVGLSRVYINAHFMTDVLVGWILGILALFLIYK